MITKITQYGKGTKVGGWDKYGDTNSNKFIGNRDNELINGVSCALTQMFALRILAKPGDWLQIVFPTGQVYLRRYDDTAPQAEYRCDFFNYYAFDEQMDNFGDTADVRVLTFTSSAIANPV